MQDQTQWFWLYSLTLPSLSTAPSVVHLWAPLAFRKPSKQVQGPAGNGLLPCMTLTSEQIKKGLGNKKSSNKRLVALTLWFQTGQATGRQLTLVLGLGQVSLSTLNILGFLLPSPDSTQALHVLPSSRMVSRHELEAEKQLSKL